MTATLRQSLLRDCIASLVGLMVAVPLCLGIAIASGAPPATGLLAGIVGCIVVGALTTAPVMVTGPAAGMIAVTFATVQNVGLPQLGLVVVLAGLIQILTGVFRFGQLFRAITPSVLHGMMAGIGLMIFLGQFQLMFGVVPRGSAWENLLAIPGTLAGALGGGAASLAGSVSMVTLLVLLAYRFLPERLKVLPASFYAVVAAIAMAQGLHMTGIAYVSLPSNFAASLKAFDGFAWHAALSRDVLLTALAMAFIGSSKALLTASAAEQMHDGQRTQNNREVIGQGVGNIVSGLLGGLPLSGEILRTVVNIRAGGRSRLSLILIGLWMLLVVLFLPGVLGLIPIAGLAALLVYTGAQLVDVGHIRELGRYGRAEVIIYALTALAVVFIDPLEGVLIGMVLGLLRLAMQLSNLVVEMEKALDEDDRMHIRLSGRGTFVNLPRLASTLEAVDPGRRVLLDVDRLEYVDNAFYQFLRSWHRGYAFTGGHIMVRWEALEARLHNTTDSAPDTASPGLADAARGKTGPPAA